MAAQLAKWPIRDPGHGGYEKAVRQQIRANVHANERIGDEAGRQQESARAQNGRFYLLEISAKNHGIDRLS
jgi:hypothetical protein